MGAGPPPDQFLVALAVLSLLSEVAADQPLVCIVDDYQWLDFASALALSFASRRLGTESVGMVVATRVTTERWRAQCLFHFHAPRGGRSLAFQCACSPLA